MKKKIIIYAAIVLIAAASIWWFVFRANLSIESIDNLTKVVEFEFNGTRFSHDFKALPMGKDYKINAIWTLQVYLKGNKLFINAVRGRKVVRQESRDVFS